MGMLLALPTLRIVLLGWRDTMTSSLISLLALRRSTSVAIPAAVPNMVRLRKCIKHRTTSVVIRGPAGDTVTAPEAVIVRDAIQALLFRFVVNQYRLGDAYDVHVIALAALPLGLGAPVLVRRAPSPLPLVAVPVAAALVAPET